jgi:hypothetical protein
MFSNTLNPAPQGIDANPYPIDGAPIEVDVAPEEGEEQDTPAAPAAPAAFSDNLAEHIDEDEMARIAEEIVEDYEIDLASRGEWEKTYKDGLNLLGLSIEDRTEPWSGACGVFHPLLAEAVVRFQAEAITETFPAAGPVKSKIVGKSTPAKEKAAERVQADMNYQLTEVMTEFRKEHERLLWNVGAAGAGFKKVYFDPSLGRATSVFAGAEDVVVSYGATDLYTAQRVTFRMKKTKHDYEKLVASGFYRDVELGDPLPEQSDIDKAKDQLTGQDGGDDDRYTFLEAQVDLDIEGFEDSSGLAVPYVVHVDKSSQKVLAVYRNWKESDIRKRKRQHFVQYGYVPGFGFYDFGLIHLVGGFASSATSMVRQLVDAGTLSNLPGGLKSRGLRIKGDDTPISPGEWRDVDVPGGVIRDNILPLPYKEPSATLYQLYKDVVEEGRRFANTSDADVSDMGKEAPVGTTLALLERALKSSNAVQARIHASMKIELKLLKDIIAESAPTYIDDMVDTGDRKAAQADYAMTEVIPVSDPQAATMSQRVVQYDAAMKLSATAPQIYDLKYMHAEMLKVLGIKNVDKCIPNSGEQTPKDPITENMSLLNCQPVKAFLNQDHEAHLSVHIAATQDPLMMQVIGQNPQAQKIVASAQAHIAEHLGFQYRVQMEQVSGQKFPPPGEPIPPELEVQLSRGMAQAAQALLAQNKGIAAQRQAEQAAQDPVVQAQQMDLKIKAAEVDRKVAKDKVDEALESRKLDIMEKTVVANQENTAFTGITNAIVQKHAQEAQQENTTLQSLVGATTQAHAAEQQKERTKVQGSHNIANTVLGHLIAGQKNSGPRPGAE